MSEKTIALAEKLAGGLRWYLSLNYREHIEGSHEKPSFYAPLTILVDDGEAFDREISPRRIEVCIGPPTTESLQLELIQAGHGVFGVEIKDRMVSLTRQVIRWADATYEAVERWQWDEGDKYGYEWPNQLRELIGADLIAQLEELRDEAFSIERLTETVPQLMAADDQSDEGPPLPVSDRIYAALDEDPRRRSWTAGEWAELIGCSERTIRRTEAWGELRYAIQEAKQGLTPD